MSIQFKIAAYARSDMGKGASRRLRRLNDKVPAIVYGADKAPQNIELEHRIVWRALQDEAFYTHVLSLDIDGKHEKVILKDVQRHPYKSLIMHLDFLRVTGKEKLHMHIPLHFLNEATAPGVLAGGVLHRENHVDIICSVGDLPEFIEVDLSTLEMNGVIHLSDIKLPKGVESTAIQHGDNPTIASIHMPRVIADSEPETEAETEAAPAVPEKEASGDASA